MAEAPSEAIPEHKGIEQKFIGELERAMIRVKDDNVEELAKRGYGDKEDGKLLLRIYEAMHLYRLGLLAINSGDKAVEFSELVNICLREDRRGWTKFLVYRDLRTRGYVVREGYGIRSDLRVYERGDYGVSAAKFVVIPLNEGEKVGLSTLKQIIETVYRMGKEPLVAVVERRGEIIYYRASKMVFERI
ncbi:MAG: tRNA-intron lyase [Nitrososphaerota archaeon]